MRRILFLLLPLAIAVTASLSPAADKNADSKEKPAKKKKVATLPEGTRVIRDLSYKHPKGRNEPLLLDVYFPEKTGTTPLPVVVWVHGGGWKNGSKNKCKAAWLAQEGFAVVSIEYRLTDEAIWPAQIDDCRDAVRWVRKNADKYDFNPNSIGAWGSSAGGHLVALMGTLPLPENDRPSGRVQAVCDWFGPTELLTMPPNVVADGRSEADVAKSNGALLLGVTVKDDPEKAKLASAHDQVSKDDAPFLIMHGSADPAVPVVQSEQFHKRLLEIGVPSTLYIVPNGGHGGKGWEGPEINEMVLQFFDAQLKNDA